MNTLIIFMTSHGCARKAAERIADLLAGTALTVDLEQTDPPSLDPFDTVIIGGSIRIGRIQKRIRRFCEKNLDELVTKRIGLFICCMHEGDRAAEQLLSNFPQKLTYHATATAIVGGELDFGSLTSFEQMLIRDIIGITENVSLFDDRAVRRFTDEMQMCNGSPD